MVRTIKSSHHGTGQEVKKAGTATGPRPQNTTEKETEMNMNEAKKIIDTAVKGVEESVAWALHDIRRVGYENVPPDTANRLAALGHRLNCEALDLDGVGIEEVA